MPFEFPSFGMPDQVLILQGAKPSHSLTGLLEVRINPISPALSV